MHAHAAADGARESRRRRVATATWSSSSSAVLDEKVHVTTAPAATANKVETGDDAPAPGAGRAASELTTSCWLFSSLATAPRIITKSLSDAHLADSMTTASKAMSVLHYQQSVPKPSHSEGHVSDSSLSSVGESHSQQTLELTVYNGRSSSIKDWCATDASSDDSSLYTVDEDGFHADDAHASRDAADEAVDELVHCATLQNEQLRMMTSGYVHRRCDDHSSDAAHINNMLCTTPGVR